MLFLSSHLLLCVMTASSDSFTAALSKETARHGITVNCVAPGFIDTPMVKTIPPQLYKQMVCIDFSGVCSCCLCECIAIPPQLYKQLVCIDFSGVCSCFLCEGCDIGVCGDACLRVHSCCGGEFVELLCVFHTACFVVTTFARGV